MFRRHPRRNHVIHGGHIIGEGRGQTFVGFGGGVIKAHGRSSTEWTGPHLRPR
jgi:hypothetical protein